MLQEIITGSLINSVIGGIKRIIKKTKKNSEWKKLFIKTGDFLSDNTDQSEAFHKDLLCIFSKKNMRKISNNLKGKSGYELKGLLHNQLKELMENYEIDSNEAETYIHFFMEIVLKELESKSKKEYDRIFLREWREEEAIEYEMIKSELLETNKNVKIIKSTIEDLAEPKAIFTIEDIDEKLKNETDKPQIDLDFFKNDDEEFEDRLIDQINDETIYIEGKSKEETIYYILNIIQKQKVDRKTLVITSEKTWLKIPESGLKNTILIPLFFAETIPPIPNNTNIFVYGEDEPCYYSGKIVLRKRTMKSLVDSLESAGLSHKDAYRLAEDTHGLFVPIKRRIYKGALYKKPGWAKNPSNIYLAALLCGKWTDNEGDKQVIEQLSGVTYDEFIDSLSKYKSGENPFIVEVEIHGKKSIQLASVQDAWEELDGYITKDLWSSFLNTFFDVMTTLDPIFKYPFNKHFEANLYAEKPNWSKTLKCGMIRSLIMRTYCKGHTNDQYQVDDVISQILNTIDSITKWGYIAQYFTGLCEAAPDVVLEKLESELNNSTGLIELFEANDGNMLTGRNYYTNILWAIEQYLQQEKYVARAVDWLWEMNSYDIHYSITNSPASVLETVFCASISTCALDYKQKKQSVKNAIQKYSNAWDVVYSELPNVNGFVWTTLSAPMYRVVEEPKKLTNDEINKTYIFYLDECIKNIGLSSNRWNKIISLIDLYSDAIQEDFFEKLVTAINDMDDEDRITIKNEIRRIIHNKRYYVASSQSLSEKYIRRLESAMDGIKTIDPVYEYIYLFEDRYNFPLLNPIPFNREESNTDIREKNKEMIEGEIEKSIIDFYDKGLSLKRLLELSNKDYNSLIGYYIAKYYGNGKYSESIIYLMLEVNNSKKVICDYVCYFSEINTEVIKTSVEIVKEKTNDQQLIVELLLLEPFDRGEEALINKEKDDIKNLYWSSVSRLGDDHDRKTFEWAINQCKRYGTINTFLSILFDARNKLPVEEIYSNMVELDGLDYKPIDTMSKYYLEELLKTVKEYAMDDEEKSIKMHRVEWLFRNVLKWEEMVFTQYWMKKNPKLYATLVSYIFLKDGETKETSNSEKKRMASELFDIYYKAHFCPTEDNGIVNYDLLKQWVLDFKNLLIEQKQERLLRYLIGRLFVYSPVGKDSCMPCEAVREIIEEYYDESLKDSYVIAEENKRGVFNPDAGKTEKEMSDNYKENANMIRSEYPKTARIFDQLSQDYMNQSERERMSAENEC